MTEWNNDHTEQQVNSESCKGISKLADNGKTVLVSSQHEERRENRKAIVYIYKITAKV